jgi:hypothetical protein
MEGVKLGLCVDSMGRVGKTGLDDACLTSVAADSKWIVWPFILKPFWRYKMEM